MKAVATDAVSWINMAVEYQRKCECGRVYKNHPLSRRWLDRLLEERPAAHAKIVREIPGLCVPVLCPACERRVIQTEYRPPEFEPLVSTNAPAMHQGRFTQRLSALAEMFGRELSIDALAEYYRALNRRMSWDDFDRACSNISRSEMRFMPKPGEILAYARHGAA